MNVPYKFGDLILIKPKDSDEVKYYNYLNLPIIFLITRFIEIDAYDVVALVNGLKCRIQILKTDEVTILSSAADAETL